MTYTQMPAAYAGADTLPHKCDPMRRDPMNRVFVYGTLQQGRSNHHWATNVATPTIQPAMLRGFALYDLGPYPAIVPAACGTIHGELLSYPTAAMPAVLSLMDRLEGYRGPQHPANLYHREAHAVTLADGTTLPAWVYVYAHPLGGAVLVEGGRW